MLVAILISYISNSSSSKVRTSSISNPAAGGDIVIDISAPAYQSLITCYLRLGFRQSSLITSRVTLNSSLSWSVTWRKNKKLALLLKNNPMPWCILSQHCHNYTLHFMLPPRLITNVKSSGIIFTTISSIHELGEERDRTKSDPKEGTEYWVSRTPSLNPLR